MIASAGGDTAQQPAVQQNSKSCDNRPHQQQRILGSRLTPEINGFKRGHWAADSGAAEDAAEQAPMQQKTEAPAAADNSCRGKDLSRRLSRG